MKKPCKMFNFVKTCLIVLSYKVNEKLKKESLVVCVKWFAYLCMFRYLKGGFLDWFKFESRTNWNVRSGSI